MEGSTVIAPAIQREGHTHTHTHTHTLNTHVCVTLAAAEITLTPVHPDFTSVKVQDIFRILVSHTHTHTHAHTKKVCFKVLNISLCAQGPLPAFSAEHSWSSPRTVTLSRVEGELGFSIRGAKPVTVSGVDKDSQAEVSSNHLQIDHVVLLSVCSFPGHINGAWE